MPRKTLGQFDGVATLKTPQGNVRYLVEEKQHLRHLDVAIVVDQLNRRQDLPADYQTMRVLLLAPHIRREQAAVLERAEIDYLDLAGNAHLRAPNLLIHVEGRPQQKDLVQTRGGRPQKGWIKTVMAILIRPGLTNAPYRDLAEHANVALGTVTGCMHDLAARGLLLKGRTGRRVTDREALVALWVPAYIEGLRPKLKERRFQMRAERKQEIWARLQKVLAKQPWALTGADAAERYTKFFRTDETEIYAPVHEFEDRATQKAIVAQPTLRDGNLLVIEPPGPLAIPETEDGPPVAPALLAYAELRYRGTGQALEAADLLLPKVLENGAH